MEEEYVLLNKNLLKEYEDKITELRNANIWASFINNK